jgi:hypothetical protein
MTNTLNVVQSNIQLKKQHITKKVQLQLSKLYTTFNNVTIAPHTVSFSQNDNKNYGENFDFIPNMFTQYIRTKMHFITTISTIVKNKHVNIHIYQENAYFKNKRHINNILKLINFMSLFSKPICSQYLDIHIYFTPFKKTLPTMDVPLSKHNINTGFTYACAKKNQIHIYRKEEWFKVLIHESIHAFGLDFSNIPNDSLSKFFHLGFDIKFSEAYCETLSIILQTFFLPHTGDFITHFKQHIYNETIFTLQQAAKILSFNNINVSHLIASKTHNKYTEETPVFSYFILKSINLYFIGDFLTLCMHVNNNIIHHDFNINEVIMFSNFIKDKSNNKKWFNDITLTQNIINKDKRVNKSLKFSLYG